MATFFSMMGRQKTVRPMRPGGSRANTLFDNITPSRTSHPLLSNATMTQNGATTVRAGVIHDDPRGGPPRPVLRRGKPERDRQVPRLLGFRDLLESPGGAAPENVVAHLQGDLPALRQVAAEGHRRHAALPVTVIRGRGGGRVFEGRVVVDDLAPFEGRVAHRAGRHQRQPPPPALPSTQGPPGDG
jgi:hypothetical protein